MNTLASGIGRQQQSEQDLMRFRDESHRLPSVATDSLPALVAALESNIGKSMSTQKVWVSQRPFVAQVRIGPT